MMFKNIFYTDEGEPHASPVVVLIHAFPLNHTLWKPQMSVLTKKNRVIAYDVRGHGKSEVGDTHYTIDFFVDDLISLLDELKIEKAILCGISMGGYIALRALELFPKRFNALVLCDTQSNADSNEAKIKRSDGLKRLKEKGVLVYAEEFVQNALAPTTLETNTDVVNAVKEMIQTNNPQAIAGTLLALACRTDTTQSLASITIPTLILVGEKDKITPSSSSKLMQEKIPNSQMHIIPNAGHLSNLENPVDFNQRLLSFIESIQA